MTSINPTSGLIDLASIKKLDVKPDVRKLSDAEIAQMEDIWKNQFRIFTSKPDNDPDNIYATVKVGGEVVATIYNSGGAVTANADAGKLANMPGTQPNDTAIGPELAQQRAEYIAKKLGGTYEKASTAQTAAQWSPTKIEWTYDYKAMEAAQKERDALIGEGRKAMDARSAYAAGKAIAQILTQSDAI